MLPSSLPHPSLRNFFLPLGLAIVQAVTCPGRTAEPIQVEGAKVEVAEALIREAEATEGDAYWSAVRKLEALGAEIVPVLLDRMTADGERARLACARAVIALGDEGSRGRAFEVVRTLARSATAKDMRVAAIEIFGRQGDPDDALALLDGIFESTADPDILIPVAQALWDVDRVKEARDKLVDLLGSSDPLVKQRAALALAEIAYYEGEVRDVLRTLKDEPSPLGLRARSLDKIVRLSRQLDAASAAGAEETAGTDAQKLLRIKEERIRELERRLAAPKAPADVTPRGSPFDSVVDEVALQVQESYVDEAKTDRRRLTLSALRGMLSELDEFSSFMDPEETKAFRQGMSGEYFGIGAQVHKSQGEPLEVVKPIYGGPAYRAGILSGDRIVEVQGASTSDLDTEDVVERLKGPAGTTVRLKVFRRGWTEPREFVVERRMVEVPSVYSEMLPGNIGYLLLLQFGEKSADEFIAALDRLEKEEMEGLILDVRNDPGGRLDIAIRIVDQFVAGDLPIVTQKGRGKGSSAKEVATYPDPFSRPNYPMIVLVNERSASASEILAGALQDFGRAKLVGKRTYGKGSVQRLIPLSSEAEKLLGGESQLRLTVQYYFLPLGRCIHTVRDDSGTVTQQGGVGPDVEVEPEKVPVWRLEERERLRNHELVLEYAEEHATEIQKLFADGADGDASAFPGFDDLYGRLATPAPRDDLRAVLRYHARRALEDKNGKEFSCDYQEDIQLQAAILEVLGKLGVSAKSIPRYAGLAKKG